MLTFIESILMSLGGLTACVILIIKFGGNKLAETLSRRYEQKYGYELDKKLEAYKLQLGEKLASHQSNEGDPNPSEQTWYSPPRWKFAGGMEPAK